MSAIGIACVGYAESARRHFHDAGVLLNGGREPNAGQLFGFAAECGVKAILVACGAPADSEGSIGKPTGVAGKGFKEHMPQLHQAAVAFGSLVPDGRFTAKYMAAMPNLSHFADWLVAHRYWYAGAIPIASVGKWQSAAGEVLAALDQAKNDGVL
jgi:hypothetical protein